MITVSTAPSVKTGGIDELSKFCQSRLFASAISLFGGSLRLMCSRTVALSGSDADVSAGSAATLATNELSLSSALADASLFAGTTTFTGNEVIRPRKYPAVSHAKSEVNKI